MNKNFRRLAGSTAGDFGHVDGTPDVARLNCPMDVVVTPDGQSLIVADFGNSALRILDLDTNYLDTLCTLSDRPTHLAIDDSTIYCTGRQGIISGPGTYNSVNLDGTGLSTVGVGGFYDPPFADSFAGAIALGVSYGDLYKYPIKAYTGGWWLVGGSEPPYPLFPLCEFDVIPGPVHNRDGAYAGDAGCCSSDGRLISIHEYVYPSNHAFGVSGDGRMGFPHLTCPSPPADNPCDYWTEDDSGMCGPIQGHRSATVVVNGEDGWNGAPGWQMIRLSGGADGGQTANSLHNKMEGIIQLNNWAIADKSLSVTSDWVMPEINNRPFHGLGYRATSDSFYLSSSWDADTAGISNETPYNTIWTVGPEALSTIGASGHLFTTPPEQTNAAPVGLNRLPIGTRRHLGGLPTN